MTAAPEPVRAGGSVTVLPRRHPSSLPPLSPGGGDIAGRADIAGRLRDIGTGAVAAAALAQLSGVVLRTVSSDGTLPADAGDALLVGGVVAVVLGAGALVAARGLGRRALAGTAAVAGIVAGVLAVAGVVLAFDDRGDGARDTPPAAPAASVPTAGVTTTTSPVAASVGSGSAATVDPTSSPGAAIAAQGLGGGNGRTPALPPGVSFPNGDASRRGSPAVPWGGQTLAPTSAEGASGGSPDGGATTASTHGGH